MEGRDWNESDKREGGVARTDWDGPALESEQQARVSTTERRKRREKRALFISVHGDPLARMGNAQTGGQNIYVKELARELAGRGWQVDVFSHWENPDDPQIEPITGRSRVIRLAAGVKGFVEKDQMYEYLPAFVDELREFCRAEFGPAWATEYDVLHSHYWLSGWVGTRIRSREGVPQIHTSHSIGVDKAESLTKVSPVLTQVRIPVETRVYARADRVVATTSLEMEKLKARYGCPGQRIRVVPCGVNLDIFYPRGRDAARSRLGLDPLQRVILFAGRFAAQKGIDTLLAGFKLLADRHPDERLLLLMAGGDPLDIPEEQLSDMKRHMMEWIRTNGLEGRARFLGPVDQNRLADCYSAADVCAVPSVYEPFGMVAVEAMACACPVVASRVGGLSYSVRDGESGLLVSPRRPDELASALARVALDPELGSRLSKGAHARAKEFSWETVASRIEMVYHEVMAHETWHWIAAPRSGY